jgi:hypothetical protein
MRELLNGYGMLHFLLLDKIAGFNIKKSKEFNLLIVKDQEFIVKKKFIQKFYKALNLCMKIQKFIK